MSEGSDTPTAPNGYALYVAVREHVETIKAADPMAPVTVVLPSDLAALGFRRFLAAGIGGRSGVAGVAVTTGEHLAEWIGAPAEQRRKVTGRVVDAAIRRVLRGDPGMFADISDNSRTVAALAGAYQQLQDVYVAADGPELIARIGQVPLGRDVVRVFRAVRGILRGDWYDDADVVQTATHAVRSGGLEVSAAELGTVIVAARRDRPRAQSQFIEALLAQVPSRVVGLSETPDAPASTAEEVLHAADPDDEVRTVVRRIVADLGAQPGGDGLRGGAGPLSGHQVAVVYTAQSPYARLLHTHLESADITWTGPDSRPLSARAAGRSLLALLALPEGDFARNDVFSVLWSVRATDFSGELAPVTRWDRIARDAGVVGGDDWADRVTRCAAEQWRAAEEADADGDSERAERKRARAADVDGLAAFMAELRRRFAHIERSGQSGNGAGWTAVVEQVGALWSELTARRQDRSAMPAAERAGFDSVARVLGELTELAPYEQDGVGVGVGMLRRLREIAAAEMRTSTAWVGTFGEGVFVGPVSSMRGLAFDRVYVVGLSEDLYPGRVGEDPLLPDCVRDELDGALADVRERVGEMRAELYAAFAAGEHTTATFARGDVRSSGERLPSRWLLPTLTELAVDGDGRAVVATEWAGRPYRSVIAAESFAQNLRGASLPATEQEWRVQAAAARTLDDPVVRAADAMERGRAAAAFTRFDGNVAGPDGTAAEALPDFADGVSAAAPTSLEMYATCPYSYFVRHLLGVQPLEDPGRSSEISALDIGTLVHSAVDDLIGGLAADERPGPGEPWTDEHLRSLLAHFDGHVEQLRSVGATGHDALWRRTRPELEDALRTYLASDSAWRRDRDAGVYASEIRFGVAGTPQVHVPLPDGRAVAVRGSADRVDIGSDGTVYVTDLKTGRSTGFDAISAKDPTVGGTKLQLPAYAYAARAVLDRPDAPVTTQYWFVRDGNKTTSLELTDAVSRAYAHVLQVLVDAISAGRFPARAPSKPDHNFIQCEYCNPDGIGYVPIGDRWRRKREATELAPLAGLIDPEEAR